MARVTVVKKAQKRYATTPVLDEEGNPVKTPVMRRDGTQKTTKSGHPIFRTKAVKDKDRPLPNLRCEKCGVEIEPGMSYKWVAPKSGPYGGHKRSRCMDCPYWRPSELTGSESLSMIYAAQENFEDALDGWGRTDIEELRDACENFANDINEAAEYCREAAQNIEDGFGHPTYQSEEMEARADTLDGAVGVAECADLEEFDEDDARAIAEMEVDDEIEDELTNPDDRDDEIKRLIEEAREEWADAQVEVAREALDEVIV